MKVYPAIDIYEGEVVRLEKGKRENMIAYGDPIDYAKRFEKFVDKLHVVDLEGSFEGRPKNLDVVEQIIQNTSLDIQLGGGFREIEQIDDAYSVGVENVIISTKAFDQSFLQRATEKYDGITVSLDVKNGELATEGWERTVDIGLEDAFDGLIPYVNRFIYTATGKDGLLEGIGRVPDLPKKAETIYAGGVTSIEDVEKLKESDFDGCIIGRALYEGKLSMKEVSEVID